MIMMMEMITMREKVFRIIILQSLLIVISLVLEGDCDVSELNLHGANYHRHLKSRRFQRQDDNNDIVVDSNSYGYAEMNGVGNSDASRFSLVSGYIDKLPEQPLLDNVQANEINAAFEDISSSHNGYNYERPSIPFEPVIPQRPDTGAAKYPSDFNVPSTSSPSPNIPEYPESTPGIPSPSYSESTSSPGIPTAPSYSQSPSTPSEYPSYSESPSTPGAPSIPNYSEGPGRPSEYPSYSESPSSPKYSSTSGVPSYPETTGAPSFSEDQGPSSPEYPSTPAQPSYPESPSSPAYPSSPSGLITPNGSSNTPGYSESPSSPAYPSAPSYTGYPESSNAPEVPSTPSAPSYTDSPIGMLSSPSPFAPPKSKEPFEGYDYSRPSSNFPLPSDNQLYSSYPSAPSTSENYPGPLTTLYPPIGTASPAPGYSQQPSEETPLSPSSSLPEETPSVPYSPSSPSPFKPAPTQKDTPEVTGRPSEVPSYTTASPNYEGTPSASPVDYPSTVVPLEATSPSSTSSTSPPPLIRTSTTEAPSVQSETPSSRSGVDESAANIPPRTEYEQPQQPPEEKFEGYDYPRPQNPMTYPPPGTLPDSSVRY